VVVLQLEHINGEIWANIWQTECIARICPDSGKVKGWLLMHGLAANLQKRGLSNNAMDVLNGKHSSALRWGCDSPVFTCVVSA
jgi:glutamine cyclotransferase